MMLMAVGRLSLPGGNSPAMNQRCRLVRPLSQAPVVIRNRNTNKTSTSVTVFIGRSPRSFKLSTLSDDNDGRPRRRRRDHAVRRLTSETTSEIAASSRQVRKALGSPDCRTRQWRRSVQDIDCRVISAPARLIASNTLAPKASPWKRKPYPPLRRSLSGPEPHLTYRGSSAGAPAGSQACRLRRPACRGASAACGESARRRRSGGAC
jgi:hypothetical protein